MASKEEIKRQIAALQARLAEAPGTPPAKRRRSTPASVLAPSTPSPRKKAAVQRNTDNRASSSQDNRQSRTAPNPHATKKLHNSSDNRSRLSEPGSSAAPSAFFSHLKSMSMKKGDDDDATVTRTEGFEERPAPKSNVKCPIRDDRLAIVEDLVPGPTEHKPMPDDPNFDRMEPNSGIRLKQRMLSHSALQDHLSGRYFLPPSLLYSVVRLQTNKQAYEVPVEGDWVTIAVVAERGDVKFTSGPGNSKHGQGPNDEDNDVFGGKKEGKNISKKRKKGDDEEDEDSGRKGRKKYVHLRLVDLGHRSRSSVSSSDCPRGALRGDAQLSLLLFESDHFDKLIERNGKEEKVRKLWRGGSGGAFEECFPRLREGTVVALLNPKVLKPFTNTKNPSPTSSILALTPPSASAIAVIGYAADLGRCTVMRRDGKPCGSWVDRRISGGIKDYKQPEDVCEYHVQNAVQKARAGRAEFSIGTSGMSNTAHKRKSEYDPTRQWGLKPEAASRGPDGESTYVVGGLVASSGHSQALGNVSNTMGREEQARARRKADAQEDKALADLLGKNNSRASGGVSSASSKEALMMVQKARKAVTEAKERATDQKPASQALRRSLSTDVDHETQSQKKVYSAEMIKRLGFDPTTKVYGTGKVGMKPKTSDAVGKLGKHGALHREFQLGPPPGPKVRSGVTVGHLATKGGMLSTPRDSGERQDGFDDPTGGAQDIYPPNTLNNGPELGRLVSNADSGRDSDSDLEIEPSLSLEDVEVSI